MTNPATEAFARATAALVNHRDVTDSLTSLLSDAQDVMSAAALGLLLHTGDGSLEVLTATSHAAVVLELFQAQQQSGPCVDASRTNSVVAEDGAENIVARWPAVGAAIVAAGHESVRAYPMQWHAHRLGALNVFFDHPLREGRGPDRPDEQPSDDDLLGQAFADIATILIVQHRDLSQNQVTHRVELALAGRTVIEQAKGVLAYQLRVPVDEAYAELRRRARARQLTLTETAHQLVHGQAAAEEG